MESEPGPTESLSRVGPGCPTGPGHRRAVYPARHTDTRAIIGTTIPRGPQDRAAAHPRRPPRPPRREHCWQARAPRQ